MKEVELGEPTSFFDHFSLGCTQRKCETSKDIVENFRDEVLTQISLHGPMIWMVMQRNVWSDIAKWANKTTQQLFKVALPCFDDHQFKEEELGSVALKLS